MSEYVSRKNFLDNLLDIDYLKFGWLDLPWNQYVADCEQAVKDHPNYFISLVDTEQDGEVWDDKSKEIFRTWNNLWKKYGYTHENTKNWKTTVRQPKLEFSWEKDILDRLPIEQAIATPTLQTPGTVMPWHYDQFHYLGRQVNANEKEFIVRFLLFLKDWESGHYLEAGRSIVTGWRAGDVIVWHPSRGHLACNVGLTNKWTCNITGLLKNEVRLK